MSTTIRHYRRILLYLCGVGSIAFFFVLLPSYLLDPQGWSREEERQLKAIAIQVLRHKSPQSLRLPDAPQAFPFLEPLTSFQSTTQFNQYQPLTHNQTKNQSSPHSLPRPLSAHFRNLTYKQMSGVEKFIFFVGYGRSGHSIVASIMDAHPNVIIANEYYLFSKLSSRHQYLKIHTKAKLFDELYWSSYMSAVAGWRSSKNTTKSYHLAINGSWQGQFSKLKVIGDKTGGSTAMLYYDTPKIFRATLRRLRSISGVPYQAVHVVRNPYDMVATVALYQATLNPNTDKFNATVENKFNDFEVINLATTLILKKATAVRDMVQDMKLNLLEIHLEELISSPRNVVHEICEFLGVPCEEEYVEVCQNKVYKHASRSRDLVTWPVYIQRHIERAIKEFKFFRGYSFDD